MKKADEILSLLKENYREASTALEFKTPLEMLVSTILSAQCTDARVNLVTKSLFQRYSCAKDYADSSIEELESYVRSTGFYHNKAKNIIAAAKLILVKFNGNVPGTMEELVTLPGVARKTANIVLWNSFGKIEGIPVDTHVLRLSQRLGLSRSREQNKVEQDLMGQFRKEDYPHVTNLLISHGRKVCQAKKPMCRECFLFNLCEKKGVDKKFWS